MEQTEQESKQNEIFLKIEEIYQSKNKEGKETGKSFITHLLRSYFPMGKAQRVLDIPEKPMKCSITGQKLFAIGELWSEMQTDDFKNNFMTNVRASLDPDKEKRVNPFEKVANGRVIGLTGDKTDTYLCQDAYEELYNWYATKILQGDSHINWLAKDMRTKSFIGSVREKLPASEDQKKIDRLEQIAKHPKRATASLGDFSILQELQEKLKLQEKNAKGK